MLPVLQEPECLRLKKKKKKSLMSCPYCRVSPGDWVTRGGWPGQCSHPWGIQPFFWVSLLLFVGTAHSPVLWKMAFLSAVLLCPSRHSQKEERVPTERCRKPPGARVIRSVPASTLQHTLDASSGEVAAGPQLFKCCCQAGQCGRPTAG